MGGWSLITPGRGGRALAVYQEHVKEGILVESKILELDTSNEGARSERVFQV